MKRSTRPADHCKLPLIACVTLILAAERDTEVHSGTRANGL